MDIYNDLSSRFVVESKQLGATEEELNQLRAISPIDVPSEYAEIVKQATDLEINVDRSMYLRIWGPSRCIELNEAHNVHMYMPHSLAIGDDEGGRGLFYLSGKSGFGLYVTGFGNLDIDEAEYLAPTLSDLLKNNVGVERLLEY